MYTAIIVSIIAIFLAFLESKWHFKYGLIAAMVIITIFVAIRLEWGKDMPGYYATFLSFADSGLGFSDFANLIAIRGRSFELGWALLNILCRPIGFFGLVIVLAIVENIIIYDFIKRNVDKGYYWLAIFLYTFNPYMLVMGCSMLRQWLAMCILLFASRYIIHGRPWSFILFVILAGSFHTSALFFLPLYLFRYTEKMQLNISSLVWLFPLSVFWIIIGGLFAKAGVGSLISTDVFNEFDNYTTDQDFGQGSGLGFGSLFKVLMYLYCVVQAKYLAKDKKILCAILLMYVMIFPFTAVVPLGSRMNFYIDAFAIAAFPIALKASPNKLLNVAMAALCVFWNLLIYKNFFNSSTFYWSYHTYHTIFESPFWQ